RVLTRQRRAEVLITGLYLLQHRSSKLCPVCPVRHPPTVAVLQRLGSSCPIPRPDPLALPITQPQHLCRFAQSQATRLHSPHYFHSAQFLPAQSRSPQSRFLLAEGTLKGTLLMWSQGDTFNVVQHVLRRRCELRGDGYNLASCQRSQFTTCGDGCGGYCLGSLCSPSLRGSWRTLRIVLCFGSGLPEGKLTARF